MWFFLLLSLFSYTPLAGCADNEIMVESLVARIGEEMVHYTDLLRYKAVDDIMRCVKIRIAQPILEEEPLKQVTTRYVEEELIYQEARIKVPEGSGKFPEAIRKIKSESNCYNRWRNLGEKYTQLWGTQRNLMAGEGQLVRELEKRLLIDYFVREKLKGDLKSWLQEARAKTPVRYYFE